MGLVKADKLTTDYILSRVDEAQIISAYIGPFKINRVFSSPFRKDRHPSCAFRIALSGKLKFYDFAEGVTLDCFAFIAKLENCSYSDAMQRVAVDFGLVPGVKRVLTQKVIKKSEIVSDEVKKETKIEIVPSEWTTESLAFWEAFYITQPELESQQVYPIKKLFINGKIIPNYRNELRYAYVLEAQDQCYKKIYTPFASDRRFKWISNIPNHIPFGINKLTKTTNRLIISKAQKDRLIWLKYFPDVIAPQLEKTYGLNDKTRAFIKKNYDDVIIAWDNDATGIASTEHFVSLGYRSVFVPDVAKEKHGIKDIADFVKHYGIAKFEAYLKHINLL